MSGTVAPPRARVSPLRAGPDPAPPSGSTPMLEVSSLQKRYGDVQALTGVELAVRRGDIVGLLGPNGAGKTTLVSIVAGLRHADAGQVRIDGVDVRGPGWDRSKLGLVPQEMGVYPSVTVRQNLELFGRLAGLRRSRLRARIEQLTESLLLGDLLGRLGRDLSGGERRRLHTAIGLLHEPMFVLLDEPTVGADVESRNHLLRFLADDARERGTTVLYTTHHLAEIEQLCSRVIVLFGGRVAAEGELDDVVRRHASSAVTVSFVGEVPAAALPPTATVDGATIRVATDNPTAVAAQLLRTLDEHGADVAGLDIQRADLEGAYAAITRGHDATTEGD